MKAAKGTAPVAITKSFNTKFVLALDEFIDRLAIGDIIDNVIFICFNDDNYYIMNIIII